MAGLTPSFEHIEELSLALPSDSLSKLLVISYFKDFILIEKIVQI